jgi:hypothetical protein
VSITIGGREVEADGRYTIAGCEREGEALDVVCRHRGTHEVQILPASIHEALRQYLRAHPVLAVERDGREIALDLPRTRRRFKQGSDDAFRPAPRIEPVLCGRFKVRYW